MVEPHDWRHDQILQVFALHKPSTEPTANSRREEHFHAFRKFSRATFNAAVARCVANDPTFPRMSIHDLRHTAASLAVSAGANVKAVQRMLGHASAAMTLDVYADLFDDDLDDVATVLNGQVAKHL
jgi:integrase